MLTSIRLLLAFVLVVSVRGIAWAQTVSDSRSSTSVTAAATDQGMRFTATGDIVEMRLEIFSATGQKLFDTEFRRGNVLDWTAHGGAGFSADQHLWVVTVKTVGGQLRQRHGLVSLQAGQVAFQRIEREQLPAEQTQAWESSRAAQALPPLAQDADTSPFNVLPDQSTPAVTVTAHDAQAGQVTSTAGPLTFRTGNLFAGKEVERMRIAEDGKVGIGTSEPNVTLDVFGVVRASGGFRFSDGTTLTGEKGKLSVSNSSGDTLAPNAAGTGTQNRIAKWTETGGAGTLGDSLLSETAGVIEVRPTAAGSGVNPTILNPNNVSSFAQFQFYPASGPNANMSFTVVPRGAGTANNRAQFSIFRTDLFADPVNYEFASLRARDNDFVFGTGRSGTGVIRPFMLAAGYLSDNITNNGQLFLATNGNVGINTLTPTATLHVGGTVNVTGLRTETNAFSPNVIGGHSSNSVTMSVVGATIGGGGAGAFANRVTDDYGTVAGGINNRAGDNAGTTFDSSWATVGGGSNNTASGQYSAVPGGNNNTAQGDYSIATGRRAKALHDGSFVWADSANADFPSTAINQFLIRTEGGVGINTNDPKASLGLVGPTGPATLFMRAAGDPLGINFVVSTSSDPMHSNARFSISQSDGTVNLPRIIVNEDATVSISTLAAATATNLCRNGTKLADCSSSLRYKERIAPFSAGLNLLNRLRPVTFKWKERDERDVGLIAEEVAQVEPLFVTHNAAGEIQGVKYDQLSVALINAVKEQQSQIEQQREQIKKQQSLIEDLRKLVCRDNSNEDVCK